MARTKKLAFGGLGGAMAKTAQRPAPAQKYATDMLAKANALKKADTAQRPTSAQKYATDMLAKAQKQIAPGKGVSPFKSTAAKVTPTAASPQLKNKIGAVGSALAGRLMKKGGSVSVSNRADGIAKKGKTKGKMY